MVRRGDNDRKPQTRGRVRVSIQEVTWWGVSEEGEGEGKGEGRGGEGSGEWGVGVGSGEWGVGSGEWGVGSGGDDRTDEKSRAGLPSSSRRVKR